MLHTMWKVAFLENDAREQRFDVTVATVAAVAVQQISYCMVSLDHMGNIGSVVMYRARGPLETMQ